MMAFLNGAGSIRAYPHAENTGLVISDTAKVQQISFLATLFDTFFHFSHKNSHSKPFNAKCL